MTHRNANVSPFLPPAPVVDVGQGTSRRTWPAPVLADNDLDDRAGLARLWAAINEAETPRAILDELEARAEVERCIARGLPLDGVEFVNAGNLQSSSANRETVTGSDGVTYEVEYSVKLHPVGESRPTIDLDDPDAPSGAVALYVVLAGALAVLAAVFAAGVAVGMAW